MSVVFPDIDTIAQQPGFTIPDYLVLVRLRNAIAVLRKNPDMIDPMISTYDAERVRQFKQVIARPQRPLPVYEGFPVSEEMLPGIGVSIRADTENADRQIIGNTVGEMMVGTAFQEVKGTFSTATIQVACYGVTQTEANILGMLVKWLLLVFREEMEAVDGLLEATITLQDPRPVEDEALARIQHVYARIVLLQVNYIDTWGELYPDLLREVQGGATSEQ